MGQSLSRRPATATTTAPASAPDPEPAKPPRHSLPRRILASLPKPSLRSRLTSPSLPLPPRLEQTLKTRKRPWGLSRRRKAPASTEGAVPRRMDPSTEHDEHPVDRDVDEFGVITHRVPDSHTDSPAPSAKGKEKAKDVSDIGDESEQDDTLFPSSSTTPPPQSVPVEDRLDDDEQVVIAPTVSASPPSQSPPLPPTLESERPSIPPLPPVPMLPPPPYPASQQANTTPRPFPPPGTLVVVQGVVHTTDVPRSSDRPIAMSSPTPPTVNDALNPGSNPSLESSSTRPSSLPPGARSRNSRSGILPRPTSMLPTVPSSSPSEPTIGSSNIDSQRRQAASIVSGAAEHNEEEDRTHTLPHGISMAQGPVGASGLSASSIDVLGTLLSVAAAATAASLLTGSSEPIFSSGLTSSQPPPLSNPPQPPGFNSHVPSERPLSPTPTSDAGRMRHVWSSLRDRLGLGSGAHNSNQSNDTTSSGLGQGTRSSDVVRPRDPREIMLAEMARAFNLGLGLGGPTTDAPSATASVASPEPMMPDDGDILFRDRQTEQPLFPPPDSFERFLMDLQTDLRVTLMREREQEQEQEQESGVLGGATRDAEETAEDEEEDDSIPELRSLSDSDSEESDTRHFDSDDEAEPSCEEDMDDEEDVRTAQEQLSGRTSPAVSAFGSGVHSPFGVRTRPVSPSSLGASGMSLPPTTPSQPMPTAVFSGTNGETLANNFAAETDKNGNVNAAHASSSITGELGNHTSADDPSQSRLRPEQGPECQSTGAVLVGVGHNPNTSNEVEAEGIHAISGTAAVPPLDSQDPSIVLTTGPRQDSLLLGTSSLSSRPIPTTPTSLPVDSTSVAQVPSEPSTSSSSSSVVPEPNTQGSSSTHTALPDSPMPFRLPFTPSSASRTERTPGGGINWWRMYRFPAIASPNLGQQGPQGLSAFRTPTQDPSHTSTSPWPRTLDQNPQNEVIAPRGVAQSSGVHSGPAQPAQSPSAATSTDMPELVPVPNQNDSLPPSASTNGQDSNPPTNASTGLPEHRSSVVVPVIVVGLQSVNMDGRPPHVPHPHVNRTPTDDDDVEAIDFDGLEQPMSVPLHIPEPPEFRHHSSPLNTPPQEQGGQQPARGRTWQSRAANAFRNLRPSRRSADATSPQPQETPGSRTFLIYVIGGYYPPDHQIITGGNLDSFEALWELAELLGQVKPPTVSKEEIEKSGLEIIKASMLEEYEKQGRVASNCTDRCLICLDDYNPEDDLRVLMCKHTFHQGCVDRWLETGRNNCPACRTKGVGSDSAGFASAMPSDPAIA